MITLSAIESPGHIDSAGCLSLDSPLPIHGPRRVRVIVLADDPDTGEESDERLWLAAHAANPAFDDLRDPREDIYSLADGQPFRP
jgi:hypothetical protein